ncbi:MAG: hypothetical protein ACREMQ_14325 [Longimicrobiales bacterium]
MRTLIYATLLLTGFCFADVGTLSARQNGDESGKGWGGIIDWINKLSGPPFWGRGASPYWESSDGEFRVRLTVVLRKSYNESAAGMPDTASFWMVTVQPNVEFAIGSLPLDVGAGAAAHVFWGENRFLNASLIPILAQWRPRTDAEVVPCGGAALHIFAPFSASAFAPYGLRDNGWEPVINLFGAFDYRKR